jgi:glycosyltransferase involved in cell wall biosynthesis
MSAALPHIDVCICTYRRPRLLQRLLEALCDLETEGRFTCAIVVADNDRLESSRIPVAAFAASGRLPISYCVEPRQNIALARNKAVEHAKGDFLAFIDDDEFPTRRWLLNLFETCLRYEASGALGPVKPHFDEAPPRWVVDGGFYARPTYPTGFVIDWRKGRTGNLLIDRRVFAGDAQPFRPEFLTGEDQDFFRRAIDRGQVFVWCDEAVAFEVVPPVRWRRTFMLRRALLRGRISLLHPTFGLRAVVKSMVAVPAYAAVLPFALVTGQSRFMLCLVKLFDHAGRLLALAGFNPVAEPYVTE